MQPFSHLIKTVLSFPKFPSPCNIYTYHNKSHSNKSNIVDSISRSPQYQFTIMHIFLYTTHRLHSTDHLNFENKALEVS